MFCIQCGNKLENNMIFCPYCGTKTPDINQINQVNRTQSDIVINKDYAAFSNNNIANNTLDNISIWEKAIELYELAMPYKNEAYESKDNVDVTEKFIKYLEASAELGYYKSQIELGNYERHFRLNKNKLTTDDIIVIENWYKAALTNGDYREAYDKLIDLYYQNGSKEYVKKNNIDPQKIAEKYVEKTRTDKQLHEDALEVYCSYALSKGWEGIDYFEEFAKLGKTGDIYLMKYLIEYGYKIRFYVTDNKIRKKLDLPESKTLLNKALMIHKKYFMSDVDYFVIYCIIKKELLGENINKYDYNRLVLYFMRADENDEGEYNNLMYYVCGYYLGNTILQKSTDWSNDAVFAGMIDIIKFVTHYPEVSSEFYFLYGGYIEESIQLCFINALKIIHTYHHSFYSFNKKELNQLYSEKELYERIKEIFINEYHCGFSTRVKIQAFDTLLSYDKERKKLNDALGKTFIYTLKTKFGYIDNNNGVFYCYNDLYGDKCGNIDEFVKRWHLVHIYELYRNNKTLFNNVELNSIFGDIELLDEEYNGVKFMNNFNTPWIYQQTLNSISYLDYQNDTSKFFDTVNKKSYIFEYLLTYKCNIPEYYTLLEQICQMVGETNGMTPIHIAVLNGNLDLCKLLFAYGKPKDSLLFDRFGAIDLIDNYKGLIEGIGITNEVINNIKNLLLSNAFTTHSELDKILPTSVISNFETDINTYIESNSNGLSEYEMILDAASHFLPVYGSYGSASHIINGLSLSEADIERIRTSMNIPDSETIYIAMNDSMIRKEFYYGFFITEKALYQKGKHSKAKVLLNELEKKHIKRSTFSVCCKGFKLASVLSLDDNDFIEKFFYAIIDKDLGGFNNYLMEIKHTFNKKK